MVFPFEIKRTAANPYEALTEVEILDKLEKSREHAAQGMYKDATKVSCDMRENVILMNFNGHGYVRKQG